MWQHQPQHMQPLARTRQILPSLIACFIKSGHIQQVGLNRLQGWSSWHCWTGAIHNQSTHHLHAMGHSSSCTPQTASDIHTMYSSLMQPVWKHMFCKHQPVACVAIPKHVHNHQCNSGVSSRRFTSKSAVSTGSTCSATGQQPPLHDYDMQPTQIQQLCSTLQPNAAHQEVGCTPSDIMQPITGLPVVWHAAYSTPRLPPGHRFPMQVFGRIYSRLLRDGIIHQSQVHEPPHLPSRQQLCLVHTPEYVDAFRQGQLDATTQRRIGLGSMCSTSSVIVRTHAEVAGTLLTARLALQTGLAVNTAGGTHHAFPDAGSGFCILNDLAVTAKVLLNEGAVQRVLVCDLDVHQGDGTAVCLQDDPRVFTLSVHAQSNFPARKQRSSRDVGLPDGTSDSHYLSCVADVLTDALANFRPDLVLYDAGVDVHESDALGRLSITDAGLQRREALVLDTCMAAGVPVAGYVGGGYDDDLEVLAARHCILHTTAQQFWKEYGL